MNRATADGDAAGEGALLRASIDEGASWDQAEEDLPGAASASDDLRSVLALTEEAFLFFGTDLRLLRFTPRARLLVGLGEEHVGSSASEFGHRRLAHADLEQAARHALAASATVEEEAQGADGRRLRLRVGPHRVGGREAAAAAGVVVAITDVSALRGAEQEREQVRAQLRRREAAHERRHRAYAARIRRLGIELMRAERRERQRIARLLHDEFQQLLYALKIRLDAVLDGAPLAEHEAALRDLVEQTSTLAGTLRESVEPPVQETDDLAAILRGWAEYAEDRYGLAVEVECEGPVPVPDEEPRAFLTEVTRELLFNVVKHAGVDRARLGLRREGDELRVVVEDEGKGCDAAAVLERQREDGRGLAWIHRRLLLLGGRLEVDSAPGAGTRISVAMPL